MHLRCRLCQLLKKDGEEAREIKHRVTKKFEKSADIFKTSIRPRRPSHTRSSLEMPPQALMEKETNKHSTELLNTASYTCSKPR